MGGGREVPENPPPPRRPRRGAVGGDGRARRTRNEQLGEWARVRPPANRAHTGPPSWWMAAARLPSHRDEEKSVRADRGVARGTPRP